MKIFAQNIIIINIIQRSEKLLALPNCFACLSHFNLNINQR